MREQNAFHFAERRHRDAVENIVTVVEQHFRHADERGVEFVPLQHLRQLRRGDKNNLFLQAAREWHRIEIRHRADAKRRQRLLETAFALQLGCPLLALEPMAHFLYRLARSHAQLGMAVGTHINFAEITEDVPQ